jgi:hypothetical protein
MRSAIKRAVSIAIIKMVNANEIGLVIIMEIDAVVVIIINKILDIL